MEVMEIMRIDIGREAVWSCWTTPSIRYTQGQAKGEIGNVYEQWIE